MNSADLLSFLQRSPTAFHAALNLSLFLHDAGFVRLEEGDPWTLEPGGKYYVLRNDSALVAFVWGRNDLTAEGIRMMGAHTDSPCLKIKARPDSNKQGYQQLAVEVYGGALLNPWFDRDLSIAGRVTYANQAGQLQNTLVDFEKPLAVIPSLAIHLDREANNQRKIETHKHLSPVLGTCVEAFSFAEMLSTQVRQRVSDLAKVLDYELFFYDTQPPRLLGLRDELIASARLDNLLSCYVCVQALLHSDGRQSALVVCNDHEEVGSQTASGAQGSFLEHVLKRWMPDVEVYTRALSASYFISCDNAHGVHPNFPEQHDELHRPLLNGGPVIKVNANQRYASNSETQAMFRQLCQQAGVPVQDFSMRNDLACGSTIGPITAARIGVRTIDVGIPQLAMHSIRELCGSQDPGFLFKALKQYLG